MRLVRLVAADLGVPPAELLVALTYAVIVTPFLFALLVVTTAVLG